MRETGNFSSQIDSEGFGKQNTWKPAKFKSYETLGLTTTPLNPVVRPCGFRPDG